MKRLLLPALLLLALPAVADDVSLTWNPSVGATSYNVYIGTTPGVYTITLSTAGTSLSASGLAPQTTHYICVTAVNAAGESACTAEVTGWPRPQILTVGVSGLGPFTATITGDNFANGTFDVDNVAATYPGLTVTAANRSGPTQIEIDYTLDVTAVSGTVSLAILNEWVVPDAPGGFSDVAGVDNTLWVIVVDIPIPPANLQVD